MKLLMLMTLAAFWNSALFGDGQHGHLTARPLYQCEKTVATLSHPSVEIDGNLQAVPPFRFLSLKVTGDSPTWGLYTLLYQDASIPEIFHLGGPGTGDMQIEVDDVAHPTLIRLSGSHENSCAEAIYGKEECERRKARDRYFTREYFDGRAFACRPFSY